MSITTFAAIDVGSYEVGMKIFELSKKYRLREIDTIRYRLELGKDVYESGRFSSGMLEELCTVMRNYKDIMDGYRVDAYQAWGTSPFREAKNAQIAIGRVEQNTGIRISVLSNSEQRFLSYKSIAAMEADFQKMIKKSTAIVDVGGGSMQVSLFDKDALVTTQNIRLGNLRIRERLQSLEKETIHYEQLVEEFIHNELLTFQKLYLGDREVKHVIFLGDFFTDTIFHGESQEKTITREEFNRLYQTVISRSPDELAMHMGVPAEYASLIVPTAVIYKNFVDIFQTEAMWVPGTLLSDGIAYDYGEKHGFIHSRHNFENDIVVAAENIASRYLASRRHTQAVAKIALKIFDSMKKVHGLGERERLLLRIAALLHECGKYISMCDISDNSFHIIMSTEIIGLSHAERQIIASVVRYNTRDFGYYEEISRDIGADRESYLIIAKLTAIHRVANALDRSHYQKIRDLKPFLKDGQLVLTLDSERDYGLEKGLLKDKADFFEEIFGIRIRLRRKKQV